MLAACRALEHSEYYCLNADRIIIKTDHAPLKGLFNKDLCKINNPRVIKLLEKTLHFNLEVEHISGKANEAADALSRMGCNTAEALDETRNFFTTRVARINTSRIKKVGTMTNITLDLQIIAQELQTSNKYASLIKAVQEGSEPKSL